MTPRQIFVKVAQHAVGGQEETLVTLGLGSCVAILLQDREARVGGMAHVLLPEPSLARDASNPSKFASTAVPLMLGELGRLGAREALRRAGIPIVGEEVGGDYGRSVRYWIGESRTVVSSVGRPDVVL